MMEGQILDVRELDTCYDVIERNKTSISIHKYFLEKRGVLDALKIYWRKQVHGERVLYEGKQIMTLEIPGVQ